MADVALNLPFDSNEIKDILTAEFRKALDASTHLHGAKEYVKFKARFICETTLLRSGESSGTKTLSWKDVQKPEEPLTIEEIGRAELDKVDSEFESGNPNEEREQRGMPMTVERSDGRGGKTREKVRVK